MAKDIRFRRILNKMGEVAKELNNLQFSTYHPTSFWSPNINAYLYDDRFEICVDLAGVDKEAITVEILSDRLSISGQRSAPDPKCSGPGCRQILTLEIENGPFLRELRLPAEVDGEHVTARQENGILWIILPLKKPSKTTGDEV